jgi:hypothetical protein
MVLWLSVNNMSELKHNQDNAMHKSVYLRIAVVVGPDSMLPYPSLSPHYPMIASIYQNYLQLKTHLIRSARLTVPVAVER